MGSQTTQSSKGRSRSRKRLVVIAAGLLVVLCLLAAIAGNQNRGTVQIAPTNTAAPPADTPTLAPPTPTPTLKELVVVALGERNRPGVPETTVITNADTMSVVFPINDNLKREWIRNQAQRDILNTAQAIYQASGNAYDLTFTGTFAMQDAYGNVEELPVMRATLTRATLDKINWENVIMVELPVVADKYEENAGFSE